MNKNTFYEIVNYCKNSKNVDLKCLSVHIGSQILDNKPYEKMLRAVSKILSQINYNFEFVDLGGGMGIKYSNNNKKLNYKKYNSSICKFLDKHKVKIIFEPGRSIIGDTGTLVTKVIYIKDIWKVGRRWEGGWREARRRPGQPAAGQLPAWPANQKNPPTGAWKPPVKGLTAAITIIMSEGPVLPLTSNIRQ